MTETADTLIPPTTRPVDWRSVGAALEGLGARLLYQRGQRRTWAVPSPTGGYFTVEVTLGRRWCTVGVDRWHTTNRLAEPAEAWFAEHVWPHVHEGLRRRRAGCGFLPSGGGTWASAHPLDRAVLLDVLGAWIAEELTWGIPRDEWKAGWLG